MPALTTAAPAAEAASRTTYPFEMPGQRVFLYNVAHAEQHVRSKRPLIRILGVLPDAAAAIATLRDMPLDAPVFMCEARKFTLLSRAPEPEDALARIEQMAKRSHEAFQRNKQDFEARTSKAKEEFARLAKTFDDEHKGIATEAGDGEGEEGAEAPPAPTPSAQPPAPAPGDAPASEEQEDEEQDAEKGEHPARWTSDREVRNQQFACVSIMLDDDAARDEPAIAVYAAFASEEDCQHYIRNTAAAVVHEHDLLCLQMYEWAPITGDALAAIVEVGYRDDKLAEMMGGVHKNQLDVDKFRAQCAQDDVEPTVLDFSKPDAPESGGGAESKE